MHHRCIHPLREQCRRSAWAVPPESFRVLEGLHGRHPRVMGPHRDEARGGVRFENSALPINAGRYRRVHPAPVGRRD